jgi:membrane protein DedA with SNARE-associated domain
VLAFLSLLFGTFVSEDLACITAGLLIQRGEIGVGSAIGACALGIFLGDVGLWATGRLAGAAALAWPRVARQLKRRRVEDVRVWLEHHAAGAIVSSRFLPGTRMPLYVLAGVLRMPARVFAGWALVGTILWTPTLVLLTASLGYAFVEYVAVVLGAGWLPRAIAGATVLVLLRSIRRLISGTAVESARPA